MYSFLSPASYPPLHTVILYFHSLKNQSNDHSIPQIPFQPFNWFLPLFSPIAPFREFFLLVVTLLYSTCTKVIPPSKPLQSNATSLKNLPCSQIISLWPQLKILTFFLIYILIICMHSLSLSLDCNPFKNRIWFIFHVFTNIFNIGVK